MPTDRATIVFYQVNYRGGGADIACEVCLPAARKEAMLRSTILSVAKVDPRGEACTFCGIEA